MCRPPVEHRQPEPAVKLLGAIYGFVEKASTFTGSVDGSLFQFTVLPVGALTEREVTLALLVVPRVT